MYYGNPDELDVKQATGLNVPSLFMSAKRI